MNSPPDFLSPLAIRHTPGGLFSLFHTSVIYTNSCIYNSFGAFFSTACCKFSNACRKWQVQREYTYCHTQPGGNCAYTYDDNGNIATATIDGVTVAYTYDALGQLTRVDDEQENATWTYEYDLGGNILCKQKFAYDDTTTALETTAYSYGDANWRDKVTSIGGKAISYDEIGNPTSDGTWTYTWQNGRQLAAMSNGTTTASFVYNADGLRVQKTVNGLVTKYTLHGKNVVHMTQGGNELHFFYDASNRPAVVIYNGTAYAYAKNLQGDIVGILDNAGNWVVEYTYDAWGAPTSRIGSMADTLGVVNPFRYRGYVYDQEMGLYYLRSRYYNPIWCKFSNADSVVKGNIYSYCINNPINAIDYDGFECELCQRTHYTFTGIKGDKMKHILKRPKKDRMKVCQFLHFIKYMADNDWTYASRDDDGIWYGHVDCVGVYRFTMNWYYHDTPYKELDMHQTTVTGLYYSGTYRNDYKGAKGRGEITEDTEYTIGMALFRMEDKGEEGLHGEHDAFYVGDYFPGYTNAVIEAVESGVTIRTLEESIEKGGAYTHFGYLKGLDYGD